MIKKQKSNAWMQAMKRKGMAAVIGMAMVAPAAAQEQITLKFAHLFPETQYIWSEGGKAFVDEVTKNTNGRVKFEVYPAGQLGKDYIALLKSGIADLAVVVPSYSPEKFPRSSVTELPGLYASSCEGARKVWSMSREGGVLNQAEYKALGLHVLFVGTNPPNRLMTSTKQIKTVDDISGLKIRSLGGGAMDKAVRAIGAVPVRLPAPELYDAISRGTVDGAAFTYVGIPDYKLESVLKNSVEGALFGSGSFLYAISEKTWASLPDDIKDVMTKAGEASLEHLCNWQDDNDTRIRGELVEKSGFTVSNLAPEQVAAWKQRMDAVNQAWATDMDGVGKDGTALLKAFSEAKGTQ